MRDKIAGRHGSGSGSNGETKEQSDSADAQADAETDHIVEEFFVADTDISKYVRPVLAQMMYPNNHLSSLSRPPLPVPLSRHVYALPSRLHSLTFAILFLRQVHLAEA
jgi:hypothetical protein